MIKICVLYIFCLFFSCNGISNKRETKKQLSNIRKEVKKNKIQDSLTFKDLMTLEKNEALKRYGKPLKYDGFILNDGPLEFRIELLNFYSKEEVLSNSIKIEELTWEKDSLNFITVWYHKMKPKDVYIWDKRTEF